MSQLEGLFSFQRELKQTVLERANRTETKDQDTNSETALNKDRTNKNGTRIL
jgi:hypothetical protein